MEVCQSTIIYGLLAIITVIIVNVIVIYKSREISPVSILCNLTGIGLTMLFLEYICGKSVIIAWLMFVLLVMSLTVSIINYLLI